MTRTRSTPFNAMNAMPQQVTKQAPPKTSWWVSTDGRLPADERAEAQARMSATIAPAYRSAGNETE